MEKIKSSTAKIMIETCGVRKRGWMLPKKAGKSPRSPMAKVTRGVCRTLALRYPYAEMSVPAATMRTAQYGKKPRAESTTGAADRPASGIVNDQILHGDVEQRGCANGHE